MKTCNNCKETKDFSHFHSKKTSGDGRQSSCASCVKKYRKAYYAKHRQPALKYACAWRKANKPKYEHYNLQYKLAHKGLYREYYKKSGALRGRLLIDATPRWLSLEHKKQIIDFYLNCPPGYQVDHVVPLRGKQVRGLHVPWNLQYLTKSENCRKSNRLL